MDKVQRTSRSNKREKQNKNKKQKNDQQSSPQQGSRKSSSMTRYSKKIIISSNGQKEKSTQQIKKQHSIPKKKIFKKKCYTCKNWLIGKCLKLDTCNKQHYQMTTIVDQKNYLGLNTQLINKQLSNRNFFLVKIENTQIMDQASLMKLIKTPNECLQKEIQISYKYKKMMKKYKIDLKINNKDSYIDKKQKIEKNYQIHEKYLKIIQEDKKSQQAQTIINKQQILQEIKKASSIKPIITIAKEENIFNQQQQDQGLQGVVEIDEQSSDEQELKKKSVFKQIIKYKLRKIMINNESDYQFNNTSPQQTIQNIYDTMSQQQVLISQLTNEPISRLQLEQIIKNTQVNLNQKPIINKSTQLNIKVQSELSLDSVEQQFILNKEFLNSPSKSIEERYNLFKTIRDGPMNKNVNIESNEKSQPSTQISEEQKQMVLMQAHYTNFIDWKIICQTKAYRNPELQNFINQTPTFLKTEMDKVFCKAIPYLKPEYYDKKIQQERQQIQQLNEDRGIKTQFVVLYQVFFFKESLSGYNAQELSEQFTLITKDPDKSQILKMAQVILRYLTALLRQIMYGNNNQQLEEKQYFNDNITNVINMLREIIYKQKLLNTTIFQSSIDNAYIIFIPHEYM